MYGAASCRCALYFNALPVAALLSEHILATLLKMQYGKVNACFSTGLTYLAL